ncbi:MAG: hypothetical protein QM734_05395 [Cyclobacteriaceae bacterium]
MIYDKGIQEYIDAIRILRKRGINAHFQMLGAADPEHSRGIPLFTLLANGPRRRGGIFRKNG